MHLVLILLYNPNLTTPTNPNATTAIPPATPLVAAAPVNCVKLPVVVLLPVACTTPLVLLVVLLKLNDTEVLTLVDAIVDADVRVDAEKIVVADVDTDERVVADVEIVADCCWPMEKPAGRVKPSYLSGSNGSFSSLYLRTTISINSTILILQTMRSVSAANVTSHWVIAVITAASWAGLIAWAAGFCAGIARAAETGLAGGESGETAWVEREGGGCGGGSC
ncbi:MAG: hypothetical protein M1835_000213 [Candelina submexicana]|nr:MAG: hypothetical protein M1835_000213 [Candelina submexicana]